MRQNTVLKDLVIEEQSKASKAELQKLQGDLRTEKGQHEMQVEQLQKEVKSLQMKDSSLLDQNKSEL